MRSADISSDFVRNTLTLTLIFSEIWLMNAYGRPLYHDVFPYINEVIHITNIIVAVLIALFAYFKTRSLNVKTIFIFTLVCVVIAGVLLAQPINNESMPLFVLGGILVNAGRVSACIIGLVPLVTLRLKQCALCVALSLALSYVVLALFSFFAPIIGQIAFVVLPALYGGLAYPAAQKILRTTPRQSFAIRDTAITEPRTFIPFSHLFFITIFVFRSASGFSMTFNATEGTPVSMLLAVVPLIIAVMLVVFGDKARFADQLYRFSVLLIAAGFLLIIPPLTGTTTLPNSLLSAGSDCFRIITFYMLIQISRRNTANSVIVFAWGLAAVEAGSQLGFSLGEIANDLLLTDPGMAALFLAVILFLFFAYNMVVLHNFSFDKTTEGIVDATLPSRLSPDTTADLDSDVFDKVCNTLAASYSLTNREHEIMGYLARGRSVPFIQNELVISHNTVRTHVRHIYQKFDIHSQQDLISIFEHEKQSR